MPEEKLVFEDQFFSIPDNSINKNYRRLPMSPYISVQFKTGYTQDESGNLKPIWENVSTQDTKETWFDNVGKNPYQPGWENILKNDNYFDGVTLEDSSGLVNCTLRLYDRDFTNLDSLLQRVVLTQKAENAVNESRKSNSGQSYVIETREGNFQYHFRIKIGYADQVAGEDSVIKTDEDFKQRKGEKTVLKSPWLYFKMLNFKLNVEGSGLLAEVTGISIANNFLRRMQYYQSFAILKGTPERILKILASEIFISSRSKVIIVNENGGVLVDPNSEFEVPRSHISELENKISEHTENFKTEFGITWETMSSEELRKNYTTEEDGVEEFDQEQYRKAENREENFYRVEMNIHTSEPRQKRDSRGRVVLDEDGEVVYESSLANVNQLFRTFCKEVPPIFFHEKAGMISIKTEPEGYKKLILSDDDYIPVTINGERYNKPRGEFRPFEYTYSVIEVPLGNDEDERTILVRFHYKRPDTPQEYTRNYSWRANSNSIVESLTIDSKIDFANISSVSIGDGEVIYVQSANNIREEDQSTDSNEGGIKVSEIEVPSSGFVFDSRSLNSDSEVEGKDRAFVQSLNNTLSSMKARMRNGSFSGSLSIPGDPFYFFDSIVQPFQYKIKLNVQNDKNYRVENDDRNSYISGTYVLKKIKHEVNNSGFSTNLEIERFATGKS